MISAIVYDCEIIKAIPSRNEPTRPDLEYCGGWRDFPGMGISVIGVYDYQEDRYRVFLEDNLDQFQKLIDERDRIIGFNSIAFDNRLCAAFGLNVPDNKSWDLLVEIWKGAGLGSEFRYPSHIGYDLGAMTRANFGEGKALNEGAKAPILWQKGRHGEVIDYCLQDVAWTKKLTDSVHANGILRNPKHDNIVINIESPFE